MGGRGLRVSTCVLPLSTDGHMAAATGRRPPQSAWARPGSLQAADAGEGEASREPSYTAGGNVLLCAPDGEQYGRSSKN